MVDAGLGQGCVAFRLGSWMAGECIGSLEWQRSFAVALGSIGTVEVRQG